MNGGLLEVVFSNFEVLLIQHIVAFAFIENIQMCCVPPFNLLRNVLYLVLKSLKRTLNIVRRQVRYIIKQLMHI